jgi:Tol biopolymer transport system component/DNA-binding winged helix-turn-helix (wHTH) protein
VTEAVYSPRLVRFGIFEADLQSGELRKGGLKLKFSGQPFQVLAILLEQPSRIVTREELQKRLWPNTFVDVEHNLNTAINKIREVLGDSAESPRFVETLPRRGYRFIAPVEGASAAAIPTDVSGGSTQVPRRVRALHLSVLLGACVLLAGAGLFVYKRTDVPASTVQRTLTRLTFDEGLQTGATWSPDGRFLAYSSNRSGKFDIWVQQLSGGDPVQITKGPGNNWQPDWSPDGKYIAYRSEEGDGGLYSVPALGGVGLERKIASFGYYPRWSPDSSQVLFQVTQFAAYNRFFVVSLDGSPPREVLTELTASLPHSSARRAPSRDNDHWLSPVGAAWHPDGKRVSVWIREGASAAVPSLWTGPVMGGAAVRSEISPEILRQIGEVAGGPGIAEWASMDFKFSWAPSGRAIYFERTFRGARNIWRMAVDPQTLRSVGVERLTTGPGLDTELSLSSDGKKLAFTGESRHIRAWMFPFDAARGRVTGPGQAVTSPGIAAWETNLSRDGKKLAFCGEGGGTELWETSLSGGREAPIVADHSYFRDDPQWSPDGTYLAYLRQKPSTGESQLIKWSSQSRNEEPLTTFSQTFRTAFDWSPDSKFLLISQLNNGTAPSEMWLLPVAASPHAEVAARRITSDPAYNLWQEHFSPDGRWIVFEAVRDQPTRLESTLHVMPAAGGPWTPLTDGKYWDDKPRWSPDGKIIYFLSGRNGFYNVWGIHFDSAKGKAVSEPFAVTAFESPGLMVANYIPAVGLSLNQDRLVLTMAQVSGSIWVVDNADR